MIFFIRQAFKIKEKTKHNLKHHEIEHVADVKQKDDYLSCEIPYDQLKTIISI